MTAVRMDRVALVAPVEEWRRVLVAVADAGVVEPERLPGNGGAAAAALQRALARFPDRAAQRSAPQLALDPPALDALEADGDVRALAGEAELDEIRASSVEHGMVAALAGWIPARAVAPLAHRLRPLGGALVPLPRPPGVEPPTAAAAGAGAAFTPLVETYAVLPYADLNPSLFAGLAYVMMFGMMFGDVGHGALLALGGLLLFRGWPPAVRPWRRVAPFVVGAGASSIAFGVAYGEAFGPTGLVPTLWLAPLEAPIPLMGAAVAVGAALLAIAYVLGTINRWREGGAAHALLALSGIAGSALYVGLALVGAGWVRGPMTLASVGAVLAALGAALGFVGLFLEAGGRAGGALQAGIELFDAVVRLGANTISFARLAAFGLTHAALGAIVWNATTALVAHGPLGAFAAALVFVVGNAAAFALEALVAGIQALRLEYYELFSRIFVAAGRRFAPWHVPTLVPKESS